MKYAEYRRLPIEEKVKTFQPWDGFNPYLGLYKSRHYARKASWRTDVIVKVDGGYKIMTPDQYNTWRTQK